jgi:hypothetical protein
MKKQTILKFAKENGLKIDYKKYGYWEEILHLNDTAICFNMSLSDNSFSIISSEEQFPSFVTKQYIIDAVNSSSENLGSYQDKPPYGFSKFGFQKWTRV